MSFVVSPLQKPLCSHPCLLAVLQQDQRPKGINYLSAVLDPHSTWGGSVWDSSWDAGEGFGGESGKEMVQSNVRVHPSSPPFISDLNVTCPENSKLLEALLTLSIAHSALVPSVSWARSRDGDRCRVPSIAHRCFTKGSRCFHSYQLAPIKYKETLGRAELMMGAAERSLCGLCW